MTEGACQSGLADAERADQGHRPAAGDHLILQALQQCLVADHLVELFGQVAVRQGLMRVDEAVALSKHRQQVAGLPWGGLQLGAQASDGQIHRPTQAVGCVPPDLHQEIIPGHDLTQAAGQVHQQIQLAAREALLTA